MATPLTDRELKRRFKDLEERLTKARSNFQRDHSDHDPSELVHDMFGMDDDASDKPQPPRH